MSAKPASVFTIPSDAPFLDILSQALLAGFPYTLHDRTTAPNLADWTVFVPTRRAARELQMKLLADSGKSALLLPNIRPIGDVDEDLFAAQAMDVNLPAEISPIGRQFALVALVDEWVKDNLHVRLAREISASPQQAQALAASLAELIDTLETEEVSLDRLPEAYLIDLASHREAILGLLDLIRKKLPALFLTENLMGAKERRSRLLRLEAKRLVDSPPRGPVIAAGSTGTIPATRELLKAIAMLGHGAVILPGLDQVMDDESWTSVAAQHPQYALKQFIAELGVERLAIPRLGEKSGARAWLASELMRPSDVADKWQVTLAGKRDAVQAGLENVVLLEARDKNEEAAIIALIMRRELEKPTGDIALVTPDRDLARRVKAALARWNIHVDDSAGEPLIRFGAAAFLVLLMDAVQADFAAPSLAALFGHPLARFDLERPGFLHAARNIELALLRGAPMGGGLEGSLQSFDRVAANAKTDTHLHPLVRRLNEGDWQQMRGCLQQVANILRPLSRRGNGAFSGHLKILIEVAERVAGPEFWMGDEAGALRLLLDTLQQESQRFPDCGFARAALTIRHQLQLVPLRDTRKPTTRLAILGLLEARLIRPQTFILGGLNEGKWPRLADPGPWLNRPMRDIFGMQQPERQIGQTAHDFVQAFGAEKIFLTWSLRDGMEPAIPSRWILRLKTIMRAVGVTPDQPASESWQTWAEQLDLPEQVSPFGKPLPRPPLAARPQRLSVTRIETLIRDPYAIYANSVLRLEPLADISAKPDAALRGTLFHNVIGEFFAQYPKTLPANALDELVALGRLQFLPYQDNPEIMSFWWSRFLRLATWLVENESLLRRDAERVVAEVDGSMELQIGPTRFTLSARADRIDVLSDGMARIIDFKTGEPPGSKEVDAGFSPQLTLEAAMLEAGVFQGLGPFETRDLTYIKITGGVPPGVLKPVKIDPMEAARRHLANLVELLGKYQRIEQAYIPRYAIQNEDEACAHDHLSRYREWVLSGDGS